MGVTETPPIRARRVLLRRSAFALAALLVIGLLVFALLRLDLHQIGHALITASPGWIVLALALMALSLLLRAASWHETLRAALPETQVPWPAVIRATMIGVMASAVFPGRIGEPSRVLVLTRRLEGSTRRLAPVVAGTVFSQTLINLLALAALAGVTFREVPLLHAGLAGIAAARAGPLTACARVLVGPRLLALGRRSRRARIAVAADAAARMLN